MLTTNATAIGSVDRSAVLDWYRLNRRRSRSLFESRRDDAYKTSPIPLRHVIAFYEGHLPVFHLQHADQEGARRAGDRRALRAAVRARNRSRGRDRRTRGGTRLVARPPRDPAYAEQADRRILEVLENEELTRPGHPLLERAEAVFTILEHEAKSPTRRCSTFLPACVLDEDQA